jgi:hypothetical protein
MVGTKAQQTVHLARERALRKVLRRYFREQAERIAAAVVQFDQPGPAMVPLVFRADDEHELLMNTIERPLIITYCAGASEVLDIIDGSKAFGGESKIFGFNIFDIPYKLSQTVMGAIRTSVNALGKLAFWRKVQDTTAKELTDIIAASVSDGESNARLAQRIKEELGKIRGEMKADVIGVTETTNAFNAGMQIEAEELQRDGYQVSKTWVAVVDEVTRQTHSELDNVSVPVGAEFSVGGHPARFPGDHSLPVQVRANCRCTLFITDINEGADDAIP